MVQCLHCKCPVKCIALSMDYALKNKLNCIVDTEDFICFIYMQ